MPKRLVITGASRGIGLATANKFLAQGWRVLNLSRSKPEGDAIEHIFADFSTQGWQEQIKSDLEDWMNPSSKIALIHNTSILRKDSVRDAAADLPQVLQINLIAAQQLNQVVLPLMPKSSSIIYVGSTLSEKAVANTLSYTVSKHAVVGLMRATCQDLIGAEIHTAAICPGFTDTEMLRNHLGHDQGVIDSIANNVSYGRLIHPEEIAEALFFCANNPVINGSVIHANLGQIES